MRKDSPEKVISDRIKETEKSVEEIKKRIQINKTEFEKLQPMLAEPLSCLKSLKELIENQGDISEKDFIKTIDDLTERYNKAEEDLQEFVSAINERLEKEEEEE